MPQNTRRVFLWLSDAIASVVDVAVKIGRKRALRIKMFRKWMKPEPERPAAGGGRSAGEIADAATNAAASQRKIDNWDYGEDDQ